MRCVLPRQGPDALLGPSSSWNFAFAPYFDFLRDYLNIDNDNNTYATKMDTFANEVDKLLQETRREQEETKEADSDRSKKSAMRESYRGRHRNNNKTRPDHDEVPDTSRRGSTARNFSGRFVDSTRTPESSSISITITNSRGRNDSRRYARSDSKRARGPEFTKFNNSPAWTGAKSFDYGHGSLNPLQNTGPTPSTSSSSSSGFPNRLDDPGTREIDGIANPRDVSAAKIADAVATAQLLKVDISIKDRSLLCELCSRHRKVCVSSRRQPGGGITQLFLQIALILLRCSALLLHLHLPSEYATTRARLSAWTAGTATTLWRSRPGCGSSESSGQTSSSPVPPSRPKTSWPTSRPGEEDYVLNVRKFNSSTYQLHLYSVNLSIVTWQSTTISKQYIS